MYKYFKNFVEKTGCAMSGACSIHPSIFAMYNVLLYEIKEISFYLVKMKEFGFTNKKIMAKTVEALTIFMINTSLNHAKYLKLVFELDTLKHEIKEKYSNYCKTNDMPCEIIASRFTLNQNTTTSELIEFAQNNLVNKQNIDKAKQNLFEMVTLFAKLSAINVTKIKALNPSIDEFDYEILRFFALTNSFSLRKEKIVRRIKEFAHISLQIKEKLFNLEEERYGKKQSATISTSVFEGHGILVSGSDFSELEKLLNTLDEMNLDEDISIYTNGLLFLAHFHPYFKNNKHLKGHFGGDDAQYDFANFKGAILITRNFLQKIDSLYKGEIFSNKLISYSKVADVKNGDYKPLIEAALKTQGFLKTQKKQSFNVEYDISKIDLVKNFSGQNIVLVAANADNNEFLDDCKNAKVVNFNCPQETDLLLKSVQILKQKNVKMTLIFPYCTLETLNTLSALIDCDMEIHFSNCSHILINPHVFEALKGEFNTKMI